MLRIRKVILVRCFLWAMTILCHTFLILLFHVEKARLAKFEECSTATCRMEGETPYATSCYTCIMKAPMVCTALRPCHHPYEIAPSTKFMPVFRGLSCLHVCGGGDRVNIGDEEHRTRSAGRAKITLQVRLSTVIQPFTSVWGHAACFRAPLGWSLYSVSLVIYIYERLLVSVYTSLLSRSQAISLLLVCTPLIGCVRHACTNKSEARRNLL